MTASHHSCRWMRVVLLVWVIIGADNVLSAESPRAEYYAGLRSRRLYRIAEEDCLRRLADEDLPESERSELTIELSKTFAAHAAFAVGEERDELWTQAATVLEERRRENPGSRFRALLSTQRAMVPAVRGAQLRWQNELMPLDDATRTLAMTTLRDARQRLAPLPEELEETLRSSLAVSQSDRTSRDAPAPHRVHQMIRVVEFTTAVAALDLAKVLPPGADRTAALHDADQQFDELTNIARPDSMAWQSRVHRLEIAQLREPADRLTNQVRAFLKTDPPPEFRDAAVAVLVRSLLAENRPDEALATLEDHRQQHGLESEELLAMIVETLLSARRIAKEKGDADLAAELLQRSEQIDARLTGPWKALTQRRLAEAQQQDRYGAGLAKLVNEANLAWKNGNAEEAIAAFGRAATQAHQNQQSDLAVELAMTTASIQVEQNLFTDAVRSLGKLLEAYPDAKQSAEADLLRTYSLGRIYQQRAAPEHEEAYRQALQEHRTAYAESPTAIEATWMLARLAEHQRQWESALELLTSIPTESPRWLPAMARTADIFEQVLEELRSQSEPTRPWEQRAEETLSPVVETFPPAPARLTEVQAQVAASLARILLYRDPPGFPAADALLARVIDSGRVIERDSGALDPSWQALVATASQWRIISLTGQGRLADARKILNEVEDRQPGRLLDVLGGLTEIAETIGIEHRRDLGQIQLQLAERLKSQQLPLSAPEERKLDMALAQAHVAIGQWQSAATVYEELLWREPKDREVLEALATVYEECGSASCLRQALDHWQTLGFLQQRGTIAWLQSRYHMAWCSHRLGQSEAARKLIGVTQVLYPELGSPALKARFEALAEEVAAGAQK